jgi:hypothetical protein
VSRDAWSEEQRAQAERLAATIRDAIEQDGKALVAEGRVPMLNAIASALVAVEASMLAVVADRRHRKALRESMERERPRALAKALARDHGTVQVINTGAAKQ